ncbi:PREDICTED: laminin subunit beta-3 [Cyprinodon variegatus]|uniref:Laminin subunit beta 3 n=1 Tax=Cyprinodon variegatus TaxID=28743 RepID=A0A3Q2E2E4_CYPVA|nr:PREDICTED: laminin subunit beta-3 [Cyprinodon variegatus]
MRVMGTCMCHGHADRCLPEEYVNPNSNTIQVNPTCDCKHNTAGVNCERCADFYNDLPWRPAEEGNTHTCRRCDCNNHAQRCYFDPGVYEASGRRSGGVCEGCQHHTTGPKCERCAPGYQPNPRSRMDRPDACIRCICSAEGTVNGAQCEDSTGSCQCKANVEGPRCDRCKRGFYGLSSSDPLGCKQCSCSPVGSLSVLCDPVTGMCPCRPHFHGLTCDECSEGYWRPPQSKRCEPCGCDPTWSISDTCDPKTGRCECRAGFGGRTCTECADNTYGSPLSGCRPCQCDVDGTLPGVCDRKTGACMCRPGVTGTRCDSCKREHCDSFPACELCPNCFFTLDSQRKNLSLALEKLASRGPSLPGGTGDLGNLGPRIRALEASLNLIRDSVSQPSSTASQLDDALSQLDKLEDEMNRVNDNLPSPVRDPGLESELDKIQALLDSLSLIYDAKAGGGGTDPGSTEALDAIKKAYDESTEAEKKVDSTEDTVKQSSDIREEAEDLQGQVQPNNTRDLNKLKQNMATQPDLTPVAKQVCGSVRSEPCTPLQCAGEALCPAEGSQACKDGIKCVGALPLSQKADADVMDVKDRLSNLSAKITEATQMLQETQKETDQVKKLAKDLADDSKKARDELDEDLKKTRDVVKELKDFLSDPSSNLTKVQEVSDFILKAKPPISRPELKEKLEELKKLAANLPSTVNVLEEAKPQLEAAKKLLQEAEEARDKALEAKDDVTELLEDLDSTKSSFPDLEGKLQDSMDLIQNLNKDLTQAEGQLTPAEKALDDTGALMPPMKETVDRLKELLQDAEQKAPDALEDAQEAVEKAAAAEPDLKDLEDKVGQLKDKADTGGTGETDPVGDKLEKLQEKAVDLANTTQNMTDSLQGKADSLRRLQEEILQKSTKLEGLDAKLQDILKTLRSKTEKLHSCQN